jgi:hypothetical protein
VEKKKSLPPVGSRNLIPRLSSPSLDAILNIPYAIHGRAYIVDILPAQSNLKNLDWKKLTFLVEIVRILSNTWPETSASLL